MNRVELIGRLSCDPTARYSGETCVSRFNIAVDRDVKKDGQQEADFINIVTFSKTAEFAVKYMKKGMKIGVSGRIHTGSYEDKDGKKVYTTEVVAERLEFCEKKTDGNTDNSVSNDASDGFKAICADIEVDEELPFAR